MSKDSGIRSLFPGVVDEDDIKEQQAAKAAVMKRLNVQPSILPAALNERLDNLATVGSSVSFTPDFFKNQTPLTKKEIEDKKFKKMMEDEYGEKALEKDVRAKIFKNKKAGKAEYEDFATHDVIIAENMRDRARKQIKAQAKKTDDLMLKVIRHSSTPIKGYEGGTTPSLPKNKKNFIPKVGPNGLKGQLMVDPKHPDGFRYTDVNDLYKAHGDNPERYIEEVMYMYEDGPVPKAGVIKPYDQFDKSSYPMNQRNSLMKYQNAYNKLTPQQKKIVETNNKRKDSAVGKRTLKTKVEPEKLFENILPLK
tara:strand:+ start:58 stop:981 length:924 start_codon:yes stop_codon:yes gene_type:complete